MPEIIVMKEYHHKEGIWEGAEEVLGTGQLIDKLALFASVMNISSAPCFAYRVDAIHPVFREGCSESEPVASIASTFPNDWKLPAQKSRTDFSCARIL
jgi:hypothetical protein